MRRPVGGAFAWVVMAAVVLLLQAAPVARAQEPVPWEWSNPISSGYLAAQGPPGEEEEEEEGKDEAEAQARAAAGAGADEPSAGGGADGAKQAGGWWGWGGGGVRGAAPANRPPKPPVYEMPVVQPEVRRACVSCVLALMCGLWTLLIIIGRTHPFTNQTSQYHPRTNRR